MATSPGWATLGSTIAGGNKLNSELAYDQGESLGARTQDALAQAKARIDQNNAKQNLDSALSGLVQDPKERAAYVGLLQAGVNPTEVTGAQSGHFTLGQRQAAANPQTSDADAARSIFSIGDNPQIVRPAGANGEYTNVLHPDQGVQMTDLGAQIAKGKQLETAASTDEKKAQTAKAKSQTDLNNQAVSGGGKAPAGYRWTTDEQGNAKLEPVPGGPKDPAAAGPLGSREAAMLERVIGGGKQSVAALKSIMAAPTGATSGFFGVGASPGHDLLHATVDTLRNKASSDDTQAYNTMLPGLSRGLASIETMGLVPGGTFTNSFNNLEFREGDTEATRLHKLAEFRQVIDNGMDVLAHNSRLPPKDKEYVLSIQRDVQQAIPFTHADLFKMSGVPGGSVQDMVNRNHIPNGSAVPAAAAPPAAGGLPPGWSVTQ